MTNQGKLFDEDKDPYNVFKLTAAQKRNGKRGVKRCKMILENITPTHLRLKKKDR